MNSMPQTVWHHQWRELGCAWYRPIPPNLHHIKHTTVRQTIWEAYGHHHTVREHVVDLKAWLLQHAEACDDHEVLKTNYLARQLDQYNTKIVWIQQLSNDKCHWVVSGFRWHSEQMYGFRSNIWLDIITNVIFMLIRILWQPRSQCTIRSFFMTPSLPRHTKCKCSNHTERHMKQKPTENFRCLHTWRLFTHQEQFSVTQPNHVRPRRRRRMLCSLSLSFSLWTQLKSTQLCTSQRSHKSRLVTEKDFEAQQLCCRPRY